VSRRELAERYEAVAAQAYVDVITGLGNQRGFQDECERQLELVGRGHMSVSLVMLDLDDFKRANDSDGHAAGDELLARFARHIEGCIRRSDRAFRVGGDEFAIIMPATDTDGAEVVARRLLARALEPVAGKLSAMRTISFSAGISEAPRFGTTRSELFAQADAALYWSKRHGRTQVTAFDPARMAVAGRVSDELSASVATVVEQRQLRAVFQPVVDLSTGRILGYEGLVRPTTAAFSNPGALFIAAEAAGRTVDLDYACLETVAAAANTVPTECYVALNLSPRTIEAPEFNALALCRRLARLGLPVQRIVLELTERETIEDIDRLRQGLEACRALGVRIAADDVGAGNAGLRLLSLVAFDVVKIDLSLVQDALTNEPSAEILNALRDMASRRGAVVIAEGVETSAQLRLVRSVGIDAAQGYLLGRPGEPLAAATIDIQTLLESNRVARIGAAA
jgi:diguanylate cyclase (GGDEF)-like protein